MQDDPAAYAPHPLATMIAALLATNNKHPGKGRRVRVVRLVVFEGEGLAVARQLAMSLPAGARRTCGRDLTIDVHERAHEDLGPWSPPTPELDRRDEQALFDYLTGETPDAPALDRVLNRLRARLGGA